MKKVIIYTDGPKPPTRFANLTGNYRVRNGFLEEQRYATTTARGAHTSIAESEWFPARSIPHVNEDGTPAIP